jgi:type II secretory pathway pseudopilin PulG
MLIIALVLAVIALAALVFAVVTSNEVIAYICIAASVFGVILLIVDALRERQHRTADADKTDSEAGTDTGLIRQSETAAASQDGDADENPFEDHPEGPANDARDSSTTQLGAGAESAGSADYDHGAAGQTNAGKESTDNTP